MTDKDKITAVLEVWEEVFPGLHPFYWENDKVLMQGKRMWRFNDDGEVVQVVEAQ